MITIKLVGGMGNQLYGYALGRALGQTQEVQFDISNFGPGTHRQYVLPNLGLNLPLGQGKGPEVREAGLRYNGEIFRIQGDATLVGYFQSEKYFKRVESRIRSEVFLGMKLSNRAQKYADQIQSEINSCFLHVRRGDYLKEPHLSFHGNLADDSTYYQDAMSVVKTNKNDAKLFVFSDDPMYLWYCAEKYPQDIPVVGVNEFESLYLMSLCQHAIIANSSFSWWGAWLGPEQRGGMIVAPKNWFKDPNPDASDIVPERWIKL